MGGSAGGYKHFFYYHRCEFPEMAINGCRQCLNCKRNERDDGIELQGTSACFITCRKAFRALGHIFSTRTTPLVGTSTCFLAHGAAMRAFHHDFPIGRALYHSSSTFFFFFICICMYTYTGGKKHIHNEYKCYRDSKNLKINISKHYSKAIN